MSSWILFSEFKPKEYNLIDLEVTTQEGKREVAFYDVKGDQWFDPTTMENIQVIAWKKPSKPYGQESVSYKNRVQLVKEYEKWLADNQEVKDCPLSFTSFLDWKGVLHL